MFGMWRGLAGLSTCCCVLMLIHCSPQAGKKLILPGKYLPYRTGMLQRFEVGAAHLLWCSSAEEYQVYSMYNCLSLAITGEY